MSAKRGGLFETTVFALVGIAILVGLGIWQLDRKVWKENLIAAMNTRLSHAPSDLPPREDWGKLNQEREEFKRVGFPANFLPGQDALVYSAGSAFRPDVKGPGYWVFAPVRLSGGSLVIVDRGFVPLDRKDAATKAPAGSVDIVGIVRWPETRGMFTPDDDPKENTWYLRDIKAMAAAHHWHDIAPFYIEVESPTPPGGLPKPGKLVVNLPDNHLQYAITWFGMALALFAVYVVFMVRRFRRDY